MITDEWALTKFNEMNINRNLTVNEDILNNSTATVLQTLKEEIYILACSMELKEKVIHF